MSYSSSKNPEKMFDTTNRTEQSIQPSPFSWMPSELVSEVADFLDILEVIFVLGKVCHHWRDEIAFPIIFKCFNRSHTFCSVVTNYDDLFKKREGRMVLRYLLRRRVIEFAVQFHHFQTYLTHNTLYSNPNWLSNTLATVQYYFHHFKDVRFGNKTEHNVATSPGLFQQTWSYVMDFLGMSEDGCKSKTETDPSNMVLKQVVEGSKGSGKNSFFESFAFERPVSPHNVWNIGVKYASKNFHIGEVFRTQIDFWGPYIPYDWKRIPRAYLMNSSTIYLLFNICDRDSFVDLAKNPIVESLSVTSTISDCTRNCEMVLIGTRSDMAPERKVSVKEAEQFAFNRLNGSIYVEISNTEISHAFILSWYSALLKYLLHNVHCRLK